MMNVNKDLTMVKPDDLVVFSNGEMRIVKAIYKYPEDVDVFTIEDGVNGHYAFKTNGVGYKCDIGIQAVGIVNFGE